ncbi:hypothetical protein INT47_005641 [Mucor saturninus]|uniref:RNA-directed DNA polymerase n=1 Tax=Mucor saturninus TaxID=64648 RepID=A0A8H7QED6_9FUNG|nr:hypothetical protein INT47_005641 [Mucor saturninus]
MSTSNFFKFLAPPKTFDGSISANPLSWLQTLERIRTASQMNDKEMIMVAASHLEGNAARWWAVHESGITKWVQFEANFKAKFVGCHLEDAWWYELENMHQEKDQTIDDLTLRFQELTTYVNITDDRHKIRLYLRAIHRHIAIVIEQQGVPITWTALVVAAQKIETVHNKYNSNPLLYTSQPNQVPTTSLINTISNLTSSVDSMRLQLLPTRTVPQSGQPRVPKCYFCDDPGHMKPNCPKYLATPLGKANGRHTVLHIDSAQVFAAQKRNTEEAQLSENSKGKRPETNNSAFPPIQEDVPMSPAPPIQRRIRRPPQVLQVKLKKRDVWEKLKTLDSGLSMADWFAIDKEAKNNVRDGIRYLHSRKVQSHNKVHLVQTRLPSHSAAPTTAKKQDYSDTDSWDTDSNHSTTDTASETTSDSDTGYDSDDTVYSYNYNYQTLARSQPLKAPILINGQLVEAIIDSGASVSVISKSLARRLNLTTNGDQLHITSLDGLSPKPYEVTADVPIRVAGKLRPEAMCIQENSTNKNLCLLGMTWCKAYGIQLRPQESTIVIPVKHGSSFIELKGRSENTLQDHLSTPSIFSVNVRLDHSINTPNGSNQLYTYEEEAQSEKPTTDSQELPLQITKLIEENKETFVENSGLGRLAVTSHSIPVNNTTPIRSRPYRLTWEEETALSKEITELLSLGLIRPSNGTWSSPVFFVKKRDGGLRLVVDYRRLNQVTVKDSFPLPYIDDLLDSLGGASWFSTLDAASGFWQVPVSEESIERTGFVTKQGTFEFVVMPFGLTSAPSTFQRAMHIILEPFIGKFVYVFIDDIIIFSRSLQEHHNHLKVVFDTCRTANLRLKRSKCHFALRRVEYLGHVVSEEGLSPCTRNVDKIMEMSRPTNTAEVHTFLGMTGYYRRFIPGYAEVAQPLTKLLKKNTKFTWGNEQELAFGSFRVSLSTPPILAFPDKEMIQVLTTDASTRGLGAVLSQTSAINTTSESVIAYGSRALRGPENNYAATHLEALALVWGVTRFRHYLAGRRFILRTDHAALIYIINNPNPSPKLSRWAAALMEYDFSIQHTPGHGNPADALSRLLPTI